MSLFLGDFNFFRSNLGPGMVRYYLGVILEYILLFVKKPFVYSILFLEANMFCFLFSRSRHILLLDAFASLISWYQSLDLS